MLKAVSSRGWKLMAFLGVALVMAGMVGSSGAEQTLVVLSSYQDAVRFTVQKAGIEAIQVRIFNLAGEPIYESPWVLGRTLEWPLVTQQGQRVANGVLLYVLTAQNAQGQVHRWVGKLAVLDGVLQVGRPPQPYQPGPLPREGIQPQATVGDPDAIVPGRLLVGSSSFTSQDDKSVNIRGVIQFFGAGTVPNFFTQGPGNNTQFNANVSEFNVVGDPSKSQWKLMLGAALDQFSLRRSPPGSTYVEDALFMINGATGNVGIAKVAAGSPVIPFTPEAKLHIQNTINQTALRVDASAGTNAIEVRNTAVSPANTVFSVDLDGNVRADGSFNGAAFNTGTGADVAERIDVTEAVEPGDVVEIDPNTPGKFRKAREAISTRVAGIITAAPAIVLNNNFNAEEEHWEDNRPMVALAGRVPVKAIAKYGEIKVGDLLVSSPIPGYAMACPEAVRCIGAIIGKALEPLKEGVGVIEVQVMLR